MCGIAGIVAENPEQYRDAVAKMLAALQHRGPDEQRSIVLPGCVLGHTRLSIIDLATGTQPMFGAGSKYAVVFNGEIYGYKALRGSLRDYSFRTSSDTEVLLALYQEAGSEMMARLPGMFAFALWDAERRELFCARDRFGEKPFYYATGRGGELVFASEMKAIVASGLVEPVLSLSSVAHYLQRQYVHPFRTIYENVLTLPPAHTLLFSNGKSSVRRYWHLPVGTEVCDLSEAAVRFRELFQCAVDKQLVADVPVGAFLSGGLDSSSIVAAAASTGRRVKTFTVSLDSGYSESAYAESVAAMYGTEHIELRTADQNIAHLILKMAEVFDEPFGDSSSIPTYLIAAEARRHIKVVLCGDGGDELLGGYTWYRPLVWASKSKNISWWKWMVARVIARLARMSKSKNANALEWKNMGYGYQRRIGSTVAAHKRQLELFGRRRLAALGLGDAWRQCLAADPAIVAHDDVGSAMLYDVQNYMPGDVLTKIDRASMAHGLEMRAPFLDVDFASFCLSLPWTAKLSTSEDKRILRAAYADAWPEIVRTRSKQGFGAPMQTWLADYEARQLVEDFLKDRSKKIFGLLPFDETQRILGEGQSWHLWTLLVLSVWMEKWKFGLPGSGGQHVPPGNAALCETAD